MTNPEDGNKNMLEKEAPLEKKPVPMPEYKAPAADGEYFRKVTTLFQTFREDLDPEMTDYLAAAQKELILLARTDQVESIQTHPEKIALALFELLDNMSAFSPKRPAEDEEEEKQNAIEVTAADKASDEASEKRFLASKELFMRTGEKVFPEVKVDYTDLNVVLAKLSQAHPDLKGISSLPNLQQLMREEPQKVADIVQNILYSVAPIVKKLTWEKFSSSSEDGTKKMEVRSLGDIAENLYRLQIIFESIQKRIYGPGEISTQDKAQIDSLRKKAKGENTSEKPITPEEQSTLQKLNESLQREIKLESESVGTVPREYGPALQAFKSLYPTDEVFVRRLHSIAQEAKKIAEQKIKSGQTQDKTLARTKSFEEMFSQLLPAEQKALEDASREETQRRTAHSKKKGGLVTTARTPPERFLMKLLEKV